ncbi:gamma-glutamylcyclotransferase family protein [Kangiella marina]|uniref:Gamma-glutamylcyclotransferase n=1 Tax=Kangiella marina TaxID=1079178 RepID=A0ABP8IJ69_9GAMM
MYYFAYGSNMSVSRLRARVPSAQPMGCYMLDGYDLRFHKLSGDGSGKCDAYFTSNDGDRVYGALYKIDPQEKPVLDEAEAGYEEKVVTVVSSNDGSPTEATIYIAIGKESGIQPYSWYLNHVLVGAKETLLPKDYILRKIERIQPIEDENKDRSAKEWAIHD